MNKKESDFQFEFSRSIKKYYPDALYWKIRDPLADPKGVIRSSKLPFDCFMFHKDNFYAFELKLVKKCENFNFNKLAKHQIDALLKVENNGGRSYLVINYNFTPTKSQAKKLNIMIRHYLFTVIIIISDFLITKRELVINGIKSLPISVVMNAYKNKQNYPWLTFIDYKKYNNKIIWKLKL